MNTERTPQELTSYLRTLEAALADAPAEARAEILADVRAHADDALEQGRPLTEVLEALGPADEVSEQYRRELGLAGEPGRPGSFGSGIAQDPASLREAVADRGARLLHFASVAVAVVTGAFVAFLLPAFAVHSMSTGSGSTGSGSTGFGSSTEPVDMGTRIQTLFDQLGAGAILLALLPALLALLPLVLPRSLRQPVAIANAVVVSLLALISGFTVGLFYVPLAVLMWAAVVVPWRVLHGLDLATSLLWRIFGGVLVCAPGLLLVSGLITGTIVFSWGTLALVLVSVVLGVLFALGWRPVYAVIALLGMTAMVLGMVDLGLLTLAVWWVGGAWLAIGLSAVATLRPRRGAVAP